MNSNNCMLQWCIGFRIDVLLRGTTLADIIWLREEQWLLAPTSVFSPPLHIHIYFYSKCTWPKSLSLSLVQPFWPKGFCYWVGMRFTHWVSGDSNLVQSKSPIDSYLSFNILRHGFPDNLTISVNIRTITQPQRPNIDWTAFYISPNSTWQKAFRSHFKVPFVVSFVPFVVYNFFTSCHQEKM